MSQKPEDRCDLYGIDYLETAPECAGCDDAAECRSLTEKKKSEGTVQAPSPVEEEKSPVEKDVDATQVPDTPPDQSLTEAGTPRVDDKDGTIIIDEHVEPVDEIPDSQEIQRDELTTVGIVPEPLDPSCAIQEPGGEEPIPPSDADTFVDELIDVVPPGVPDDSPPKYTKKDIQRMQAELKEHNAASTKLRRQLKEAGAPLQDASSGNRTGQNEYDLREGSAGAVLVELLIEGGKLTPQGHTKVELLELVNARPNLSLSTGRRDYVFTHVRNRGFTIFKAGNPKRYWME